MKKTIIFIAVILLLLKSSLAAMAFSNTIKIAVFPFNNIKLESLDMHIPSILNSELLKHTFIETVPVEVIKQKLFDIGPSLMWTGEEGGVREGGIYWKINSKIIETVHQTGFADYYIYGDYSGFGSEWIITAHISENTVSQPEETFILSGAKEEEIAGKLKELAEDIYRSLNKGYVQNQAENIIRDYMGNLFGYDEAVTKMASLVKMNSDLIPLRALLLDLYLKEETNRTKAVNEGLNIINLYNQLKEDDVRYILSLSLDPFDVVARSYEAIGQWSEAIDIRTRALEVFPANMQAHKNSLGEAYYFNALSFEIKGNKEDAYINYGNALKYLKTSSDYYGFAVKGYREGEQQ